MTECTCGGDPKILIVQDSTYEKMVELVRNCGADKLYALIDAIAEGLDNADVPTVRTDRSK